MEKNPRGKDRRGKNRQGKYLGPFFRHSPHKFEFFYIIFFSLEVPIVVTGCNNAIVVVSCLTHKAVREDRTPVVRSSSLAQQLRFRSCFFSRFCTVLPGRISLETK